MKIYYFKLEYNQVRPYVVYSHSDPIQIMVTTNPKYGAFMGTNLKNLLMHVIIKEDILLMLNLFTVNADLISITELIISISWRKYLFRLRRKSSIRHREFRLFKKKNNVYDCRFTNRLFGIQLQI